MTADKKILIFDDDEDILSICTFVLSRQGWEILTYTDTQDIVSRVSAYQPNIIFMDNWIPEEGGIVSTRRLKQDEAARNIPVIYFSANSDIENLAAEAGAQAYLAKPFDLAELEEVIKKVSN